MTLTTGFPPNKPKKLLDPLRDAIRTQNAYVN